MSCNFRTMSEALEYRATDIGERAAFIFRDRHRKSSTVLSWADLYTLAGRFGAVLRQGGFQEDKMVRDDIAKGVGGVGRGDLVVNTLSNSPERVVCEAGIMLSGAASVNGQCQMKDGSDLLRTLRVSRATAILVDPDASNSPWNLLSHHVSLGPDGDVKSSASLPDLKKLYMVRRIEDRGPGDFLATLECRRSWFKADELTPDDMVTVFTTSGSTAFSKLVVTKHGYFHCPRSNMEITGWLLTSGKTISDIQRHLNLAPLGWIGGCLYRTLVSASTRVLCDVRAAGLPDDMSDFIWQSIVDEHCSTAYFSPKHLPGLLQKIGATDTDRGDAESLVKLKLLFLGGLPITRRMVRAGFAVSERVVVVYGATDLGLLAGLQVTDWNQYVDHDVGPPLSGVTVKIVSPDDESVEIPINEVGNILVQHDNMPTGYLNDPQATSDLFTKDGWVRTGDVGRLDERGHLIVEGRGSDAIMRGPYIHYPAWLEDRIRACPFVRDVMVVGVPDPFLNEEICACVVLRSSESLEDGSGDDSDDDDEALKQVQEWVEQDIVVSKKRPAVSQTSLLPQFRIPSGNKHQQAMSEAP